MTEVKIEIVSATRDDMNAIQHLFREMFEIYHVDQDVEYPYTESGLNYLTNCINQGIALIARADNQVIGFLTGGIEDTMAFKTYRQHGHIHNLFVLEEYRGQGLGERLIRQFARRCEDNDVHRIVTDSDDIAALRRFYTSLGFRVTGINYEMNTTANGAEE